MGCLGLTSYGLFRVKGLGFRRSIANNGKEKWKLLYRVKGLGFRFHVLGFRVQSLGFRVSGLKFMVWSLESRV